MRKGLYVFLCAGAFLACAEQSNHRSLEQSEQKSTVKKGGQFTLNGGCEINGVPAPIGSCEADDGFVVIGGFDESRDTVIFTHGWIPSYEMGVPDFPNAAGWQQEGFNTVIYRYINRASDPGDGEECDAGGTIFSLYGVLKFNCPKRAEPRIWEDGGTGEDFVSHYQSYFDQYPNYQGEIRVVGHSLGAQLATYLTYVIHHEGYVGPKPNRLELIDPWVGSSIAAGTGNVPSNTNYPIPEPLFQTGSQCDSYNNATGYCIMENSLTILRSQFGVGVVNFGSVSSGAFTYDFRKFVHYQSFSGDWLCSRNLWSDSPYCWARTMSMFTAQHFFPLLSYFWSINESLPDNGYSARTATTTYLQSPRWLRQRNQGNWCNLQNGYIFWREGGLSHLFGLARYPGDLNDGFQEIASSKEGFSQRLQSNFGFSLSSADQCAKAVSWSNDSFYESTP